LLSLSKKSLFSIGDIILVLLLDMFVFPLGSPGLSDLDLTEL
jgi:hypothetical protein